MRIFLRLYSMADLKADNGLPALILSQILLNCQQNLSSVQHLISGTRVGAWLGARGICRPSIYSVSRAPPTYSTDVWGDLSHSYLKIITINIKLRFKDRKFSRDDFFVTGLSAACACAMCSETPLIRALRGA